MKRKLARGRPKTVTPQAARVSAAFTLIELLVVVTVIAILAALLLPVLSRARDAGRTTACKSNLRQIGTALGLYLGDFQKYPLVHPLIVPRLQVAQWDVSLLPYAAMHQAVFNCPALKGSIGWTNAAWLNPSYGYNAAGSALYLGNPGLGLDGSRDFLWSPTPLPESQVLAPPEMIAIGDYPELIPGAQDGEIAGALDDRNDYLADRHNGGANVIFCDGHIEYGKQTNWMAAKDKARWRWNIDHQPHPESWH